MTKYFLRPSWWRFCILFLSGVNLILFVNDWGWVSTLVGVGSIFGAGEELGELCND